MTHPPAKRRPEAMRNDRALLVAAREVLEVHGVHASVARIADRAGVGIGSLYRRYRSKEELFQRLCAIALADYLAAARAGLTFDDPWHGLLHYVNLSITEGPGALSSIAGTITVTAEMAELSRLGDEAVGALVARAQKAGIVRPDITPVDLELLIEQLSRSPLLEQLKRQGRDDLSAAAVAARSRTIAIAVDGLKVGKRTDLPGESAGYELFWERWSVMPGEGGTPTHDTIE
ncbi:helix-turn-helix domain-containing protein [Agromyces sp. NPDC049794]|uniref:TetR/AcrR family transcriptional regulator n=1 Tax=unclassified Agromyces TaxID=2639701 RepID=UPI0033C4EC9D